MRETATIKKEIISKIEKSENPQVLQLIEQILDANGEGVFELTSEMQLEIEKGREDFTKGNYSEHKDIMQELRIWLDAK
ncbi:MAG: hypothetical protein WBG71_04860 [Leeuwenhoekiella sp.]